MTMILTSKTMVGWADVPDSDWGDFRRRQAVDISSYSIGYRVSCKSKDIVITKRIWISTDKIPMLSLEIGKTRNFET